MESMRNRRNIAEHHGEILKPLSAQAGNNPRIKARRKLLNNKTMTESVFIPGMEANNLVVMTISGQGSPVGVGKRESKFSIGPPTQSMNQPNNFQFPESNRNSDIMSS